MKKKQSNMLRKAKALLLFFLIAIVGIACEVEESALQNGFQAGKNTQSGAHSGARIKSIAAGGSHTIGLKANGTVLAAGLNSYGQTNISACDDVVQVSANLYHSVALKSDGTAAATGWNGYNQCNVTG
ncbi:MAG: hypothetical protein GY754_33065, partial [bacterium]|nr:hypothetical protein [bacterium]